MHIQLHSQDMISIDWQIHREANSLFPVYIEYIEVKTNAIAILNTI